MWNARGTRSEGDNNLRGCEIFLIGWFGDQIMKVFLARYRTLGLGGAKVVVVRKHRRRRVGP